jgi:DNA repair exonuclease SbcCD ATPase subunit
MTDTTLNMVLPGPDFANSVRDWIQEVIEVQKEALAGAACLRKHIAALHEFEQYVAGLGPADQRLIALQYLAKAHGAGTFSFKASYRQRVILSRLGTSVPPPEPSITFNELLAAAARDFHETREELEPRVAELEQSLEAAQKQIATEQANQATLSNRVTEAEEAQEEAEEEVRELETQIEALRLHLDSETAGSGKAEGKSEREPVEGHPGIYHRPASGIFTFHTQRKPDTGKPGWVSVETLEEALTLRDELKEQGNREAVAA